MKLNYMNILSEGMNKITSQLGYETPTPIQAKAIPAILKGKDIIGQAQTGSGKTAAFAIPILERLNPKSRKVQALVLCPTRELAMQTADSFRKLGKHIPGLQILAVYGGQSILRQLRELRYGVHVVIGTPGRLVDHLNRKTLNLKELSVVVLDEADEMLNMGFRDDMKTILSHTPENRQTVLFSATMPKAILEITRQYQNQPYHINIASDTMTVAEISQYYVETHEQNKIQVVSGLLHQHQPALTLVFCNTKRKVDKLVKTMQAEGHRAEGIHGDKSQRERDAVMNMFRTRTINVLVATDVASRGIDVRDVEAVVNYDVPQNAEHYVHRIGRTGRAGRKGKAFTLVVGKERAKIGQIQRHTKAQVIRLPLSSLPMKVETVG